VTDGAGRKVYELGGSWLDQVYAFNLQSKEKIVLWSQPEQIKDAARQFGFGSLTILLNYLPEELALGSHEQRAAKSLIAPTDSRFRRDQRLFEEGKVERADHEKLRLEEKQRGARKDLQEANQEYQLLFFRSDTIRNPISEQEDTLYSLKEGEESYWERRTHRQWSSLPDLF